jgi:hypothetical protein
MSVFRLNKRSHAEGSSTGGGVTRQVTASTSSRGVRKHKNNEASKSFLRQNDTLKGLDADLPLYDGAPLFVVEGGDNKVFAYADGLPKNSVARFVGISTQNGHRSPTDKNSYNEVSYAVSGVMTLRPQQNTNIQAGMIVSCRMPTEDDIPNKENRQQGKSSNNYEADIYQVGFLPPIITGHFPGRSSAFLQEINNVGKAPSEDAQNSLVKKMLGNALVAENSKLTTGEVADYILGQTEKGMLVLNLLLRMSEKSKADEIGVAVSSSVSGGDFEVLLRSI